eukprot:1014326-Amphidinium_carterae.2
MVEDYYCKVYFDNNNNNDDNDNSNNNNDNNNNNDSAGTHGLKGDRGKKNLHILIPIPQKEQREMKTHSRQMIIRLIHKLQQIQLKHLPLQPLTGIHKTNRTTDSTTHT